MLVLERERGEGGGGEERGETNTSGEGQWWGGESRWAKTPAYNDHGMPDILELGPGCGWYSGPANALDARPRQSGVKISCKSAGGWQNREPATQFVSLPERAGISQEKVGGRRIIQLNHNSDFFFLCKRFPLRN